MSEGFPPTNNRQITDHGFKESLLYRLNELREEKSLCDVSLVVDGQAYSAHKIVLAAASPYFLGLFTNDMREKTSSTIELTVISHKVIKEVLNYMYTGEIEVNYSNVKELIMAADYFLVDSLKDAGVIFLEKNMYHYNCLELRDFGVKFSCRYLQYLAHKFIGNNFMTVSKNSDFNELDVAVLKELIVHDAVGVDKEEVVFDSVLNWVKHDLSNRTTHLQELLGSVRLFSISKSALEEYLQTEQLIQESVACKNILVEALQMHLFPDRALPFYQIPRLTLKTEAKVALVIGGHTSRMKAIPRMIAYVLPKGGWYTIGTHMPDARTRLCATTCGGCLYILGGTPSWSMKRMDHRIKRWDNICQEQDVPSVTHAAVVTFQEKLFMFGGESIGDAKAFDLVFQYDPKAHQWKPLSPMSCGRVSHCAVRIETSVFVVGGYGEDVVYKSGQVYNLLTDEWAPIADMNQKRRFAAGANLNGKVFIAGGYQEDQWVAYASCELYDPQTDHWDTTLSMPIPRAVCGVVQVEDDIFLFGGENNGRFDAKLDSVVCYNGKEKTWESVTTMPVARSCLQTCVIHLPISSLKPLYQ